MRQGREEREKGEGEGEGEGGREEEERNGRIVIWRKQQKNRQVQYLERKRGKGREERKMKEMKRMGG